MQNVAHPDTAGDGETQVTWQDEQRKLSEQYSRGEISPEEFRTRRDQLFAAASGGPNSAPQPPEATQAMRPVGPPTSQGQGQPERTQIVRGMGGQSDADRTQIVHGAGQQPASGGFPAQYPAGSGVPQEDEALPWAGSEVPPLVAPGSTEWLQQGPEVFREKKGNKGKIIAVVVAIVVLAGIAFGSYMLWGRDGSGPQPGPNPQPTTTRQAPPKPVETFPLGKLPATISVRKDITQVSQFGSLNYLVPTEMQAYTGSGAKKAKMATGTLSDGSKVTILFAQAKDAQAAFTAVRRLDAIQIHNGRIQDNSAPAGVEVATIESKKVGDKQQAAGIRAHYSHNNIIVRIDISGPSLAAITPDFQTVLASELKVLPANG